MKILYVTTVSGTINSFLIPHIKMLLDLGHAVDIACSITDSMDAKLYKYGCEIHDIGFNRSPLSRNNFNAYRKLNKLIKDEQYNIVHTHTPIASIITRLICKNYQDIKVLYTAHGFHFFKNAPLKNWMLYYPIEIIASRYTDCIITINEEDYMLASKLKLRNGGSVNKIHGVGIDLIKFNQPTEIERNNLRKEYGFTEHEFILMYAAELNRNKHQDFLISVIKILKRNIPNIVLLLAGNGQLKDHYQQMINKLDLQNNIKLLGYRSDIPSLLKITDVAVASSRREGLPVNVMEAMATGLPIVVTNIRGHQDLIRNGKNGFTISKDDASAFANAIQLLYKSSKTREEFGKNNLEIIKEYSLKPVLKELEDVYSSFLDKPKMFSTVNI